MLHRLLDESGVRLGGILTDVLGASGQRLLRGQLRETEGALLELERRIFETAKRDWKEPWRLLQTLPGTGPLEAAALLAEIGDDMERFGQARRLASWAGMCPGRRESAGKRGSGRTRKGNRYLRRIPVRSRTRRRARRTCSSAR